MVRQLLDKVWAVLLPLLSKVDIGRHVEEP